MFIYQTSLRDQYYEKAVDLYYREGLSVRRIAKIIPASKTTVMRWIANFAVNNLQASVTFRVFFSSL